MILNFEEFLKFTTITFNSIPDCVCEVHRVKILHYGRQVTIFLTISGTIVHGFELPIESSASSNTNHIKMGEGDRSFRRELRSDIGLDTQISNMSR